MTTTEPRLVELGRRVLEMGVEDRLAYLSGLSEAELDLVDLAVSEAELEGADWRETPATMAHHLTRGQLRLWPYVRLLGEKFADAVEGRSKRQIWNLPRRYGKSFYASNWGPAWALDRYPWLKLLLVSYGDSLAQENAIAVRDILRNHAGRLRAQLRPDRRQARRFVTTEGGGVLAAGIRSGIVGFGAHGAVFDDPFKGWPEAHSQATRDMVDNQFRAVVAGTLETEDSWLIVPMTRWHEDDLCERLLSRAEAETGGRWELVRLPELAETVDLNHPKAWMRIPDLLDRAPGEPIEPERFSLASIKAKHHDAGTYLTSSMYQQRPAPEEGGEIKRAWFRVEDYLPPRFDTECSSWDMKLKEKESGDFVVGQKWGRTGKDFWLGEQLRGQWNQATTENAIALMAVRHPACRLHYVENTGNGPEVIEALRAGHPGYEVSDDIAGQIGMTTDEREAVSRIRRRGLAGIMPVNVKGSKSVRMRAVSGYIEAGDVHILNSSWTPIYLEEMASFPQGHDDMVDATSMALSKLARSQATVSSGAFESLPPTPINTRGSPVTVPSRTDARGRVRSAARVIVPRSPVTRR